MQTREGPIYAREKRGHLLSKSMEKTFLRYKSKPSARQAFVEAEAATYIAHQIRVLRNQRGWTQKQLAKMLGTTQAAISRLEDPDYGGITFKTMISLARVFDVAPVLKFTSVIDLMRERWVIKRASLMIPSFEEEAELVAFEEPVSKPQTIDFKANYSPFLSIESSQGNVGEIWPQEVVGASTSIKTSVRNII